MFRRKRALLLAGTTIILCLALIVGGTYALFTDEESVNVHLQAGDLDVELWRTHLTGCYVDTTDGTIKTMDEANAVNFSQTNPNTANTNIFGFDKGTALLIAPTCHFTARMEIRNEGDVAFTYVVKFTELDVTNAALAEQLMVTITEVTANADGSETKTDTAIKEVSLASILAEQKQATHDTVLKCDANNVQIIEVTVTFVDSAPDNDVNNAAQSTPDALSMVNFDMAVVATQMTHDGNH